PVDDDEIDLPLAHDPKGVRGVFRFADSGEAARAQQRAYEQSHLLVIVDYQNVNVVQRRHAGPPAPMERAEGKQKVNFGLFWPRSDDYSVIWEPDTCTSLRRVHEYDFGVSAGVHLDERLVADG